jgi:hypothetical protein
MSSTDNAEPATESTERRSDTANWATSGRLSLSDAPPQGAINLNVNGRVVTSPIQGFGKMWQKTYRIRIASAAAAPEDVIREWKANFPSFWPPGNRFYGPLTGLAPGDVALLNLTMPGRQKLSTGVLVLYADEESFTLMTPQGHVFAGWITFSAFAEDDDTVVQAQVLMRASDPAYELGLTLGGHAQENRFWEHTLTQVAAHFQQQGAVETRTLCIDSRRQWRRAGNIWHNAGIRTGIYVATTPARWAVTGTKRVFRR